ncbi:MAG: hypothetical protein RI564_06470 [Gracilimonas sp.]|jgi:hypothetical protein|nr:hypothetical protein [Gracilimonas sp.]
MKATLKILIILLPALLSSPVFSQVTAVMQAKVEIISGASLTAPNQALVDLNASSSFSEFDALNFSLTAAPHTDVNITINQNSDLQNELGEIIKLEELKVANEVSNTGEHAVSVQGKLKKGQHLKGSYKGQFTAVVDYL